MCALLSFSSRAVLYLATKRRQVRRLNEKRRTVGKNGNTKNETSNPVPGATFETVFLCLFGGWILLILHTLSARWLWQGYHRAPPPFRLCCTPCTESVR
jgi:hypothetical protein